MAHLKKLTLCGVIFLSLLSLPTQAEVYNCEADASWFPSASNTPVMPKEVNKSGKDAKGNPTSTFCDFYQFSWQSMLYLMSPSTSDASVRNFEVDANYPVLEFDAQGNPLNSCDGIKTGASLKMSLDKSHGIPEIINQAGDDNATIYDQARNVVYYEVRFNQGMCDVNSIKKMTNFPEQTTELKFAWKKLSTAETSSGDYLNMTTDIGTEKNVTLGLVGMHVAVATTDHPEFVWATYEHKTNVPDCDIRQPAPTNGWSFTSKQCAELIKPVKGDMPIQCVFNEAQSEKSITGSPTEICRVFPYGTDPGDLDATENVEDITTLNASVMSMLQGSKVKGSMKVLKNYFNVGALWVSDPKTLGSTIGNQRGSLRLANTVAETTFQDVDLNANFISNCFGCHGYEAEDAVKNKNTTSGGLSHIFDDIAVGQGLCLDVQAGPIWDNASAKKICSGENGVCQNSSNYLKWNGQWKTTTPGVMSVCGCCPN